MLENTSELWSHATFYVMKYERISWKIATTIVVKMGTITQTYQSDLLIFAISFVAYFG